MSKVNTFFLYAILIVAIVCSGCPLGSIYYNVSIFCLLAINLVYMLLFRKFTVAKKSVVFISILIILIWVSMIVNFDKDFAHYLGLTLKYIAALLAFSNLRKNMLCRKYIVVIAIIIIYSTALTVACNLIRSIPASLPIISLSGSGQWAHFHYLYYIWGGYSSLWTTLIRNSGLFREPGVFATHIALAGILLLSNEANTGFDYSTRNKIAIILFVGGMSTFSTVGVLGVGIFFVLYMLSSKRKNWKILALVGAVAIFMLFISQYQDVLFSKFNMNSVAYASMEERLQGIHSGLETSLSNPITGRGYSYYQANKVGVSTFFIIDFLGKYGIFFTAMLCYGVINMLKIASNKRMDFIVILVMYSLFLVTQGLVEDPVFMMLILWALSEKGSWLSVRREKRNAGG